MTLSKIEANPPSCVLNFPRTVEAVEKYRLLYRDITANGVDLQQVDSHALGNLAVMLVEEEILQDRLYGDDGGETMKVQGDRNIVTKRNPARDALEKLRPQILRLMKEFKMTPGSRRATLKAPGTTEDDNEFDNF